MDVLEAQEAQEGFALQEEDDLDLVGLHQDHEAKQV